MSSEKNRIYLLLTGLIILGYFWIVMSFIKGVDSKIVVCPIKTVSGYPCPSCGSTRSVLKLIDGDLFGAIIANPFGILIFLILLITPIWLFYDFIYKRDSLWQFYRKIEAFVRKRNVAIILIILVLANWLWNINKGL